MAVRLAGPLAPGEYQATPATGAIGKVVELEGKATATRADGTKVELKEGDQFSSIIETGEDGAVGLEFADESTFHSVILAESSMTWCMIQAATITRWACRSLPVHLLLSVDKFQADPAMALKRQLQPLEFEGRLLLEKFG